MLSVKYSLEEFVHDMDDMIDGQASQEKIFDKGSGYLERLINNSDAIRDEYKVPAGTSGRRANHGTYLLHHGDNGLLVTAVVWGAGDHVGPHDHRTWGMIGVIGNGITETRFKRVDDRSRDDYALLEKGRETIVKPGDVTLLIPEIDEIHQMDNFTDIPTVEIHVYGDDLRGLERSRFDLETGKITNFASGKFDNC